MLLAVVSPLGAEVTDAQVRDCIARAVAKLRSGQKADGHWETVETRAANGGYGGMTGLAVFALLQAGEPLDDPIVAKGLVALEKLTDSETYVTAFRLMAFAKAEQIAGKSLYRKQIEASVQWLEKTQSAFGTWGYEAADTAGDEQAVVTNTDNSNTQMALLALYEAARAGYKVSDPVWKRSEDYYARTQEADGSWRYRHGVAGLPKSGSMTAAGLASLLIAGSQLQTAADCGCGEAKGPRYRTNEPAAQALAWLGANFDVERNPGSEGNPWHHYYLYAVERVGILSGLRYLGEHDWFREGAEYFVGQQLPGGNFARAESRGGGACREYETALAILFLAKGHVPALVGKLRWSDRFDQWNYNRYDAENLTRWIGRKLGDQAVTWQTASLSDPLERWLKAPILYLSGRTAPRLGDADRKKLRRYVEEGGTILAVACCDSEEFAKTVRQLAAQVFPESPLEPLPETHPVYSSYEKRPTRWPLEGVTFGCRTSFLLSPKDLSCPWELAGRPGSEAGLRMGLNIAAYATAREPLPPPLVEATVSRPPPESDTDRTALYIGKVRHHGRDWNSRPKASERLLELLRAEAGIKTANRAVPVALTDDAVYRFPILLMSGHYDPGLTPDEKRRLKDYLERGGFLFAEACCGMAEFDRSFRAVMAELFPDAPLEAIPPESPLLSGEVGSRIGQVDYSQALLDEKPDMKQPLLDGVKLDDRYAVVYSPYAIGPGLDGIATFHSRGYAPADARRLALNVVLYALRF